jgi:hypothetical protein
MACNKRRSFIYKIVGFIILSGCLLLLPVLSFAQDGDGPPCSDSDPIDAGPGCPLDTWVIVLAVIAVVFATIYLYRKQKSKLNHL